jgi:hypothetical protein
VHREAVVDVFLYWMPIEQSRRLSLRRKAGVFIVNTLGPHGILKPDILFLDRHGDFREAPFAFCIPEFHVHLDRAQLSTPTDLFKNPFIIELVGTGFDKPANSRYYILRFPWL